MGREHGGPVWHTLHCQRRKLREMTELITTQQAAEICGVPEGVIRIWCDAHRVRSTRIFGSRDHIIHKASLLEYLQERKERTPDVPDT